MFEALLGALDHGLGMRGPRPGGWGPRRLDVHDHAEPSHRSDSCRHRRRTPLLASRPSIAPRDPTARRTGGDVAGRTECGVISGLARYSFVARLTCRARSSSLFHSDPGIDRRLLASAAIRLASTAKPSPPTRTSRDARALQHAQTRSPKMALSPNRSLRARENAE